MTLNLSKCVVAFKTVSIQNIHRRFKISDPNRLTDMVFFVGIISIIINVVLAVKLVQSKKHYSNKQIFDTSWGVSSTRNYSQMTFDPSRITKLKKKLKNTRNKPKRSIILITVAAIVVPFLLIVIINLSSSNTSRDTSTKHINLDKNIIIGTWTGEIEEAMNAWGERYYFERSYIFYPDGRLTEKTAYSWITGEFAGETDYYEEYGTYSVYPESKQINLTIDGDRNTYSYSITEWGELDGGMYRLQMDNENYWRARVDSQSDSKSDSSSGSTASAIVGRWSMINANGEEEFVFNSDGTFSINWYDENGNQWGEAFGNYYISGDKITITAAFEDDMAEVYRFEIDGNTLTLSYYYDDGSYGDVRGVYTKKN